MTGTDIMSKPIGANGLGLPSVPSGISSILESRRERKAGSEKIESSKLILLTFKRMARKSWVIKEFWLFMSPFGNTELLEEEIRESSSGLFLKKNTDKIIKTTAMLANIIMFLVFGIILIF